MSDVLIVYPDGTDKPGVEFKCANGFVSRVVSAVAQQNIPDAERVCQILNSADVELTSVKARLVARSKAMLWMRDVLINIRDELETDVDRVFFGSTNDADDFREVVDKLDDWQWSVIMKDAEGEDLYAELRAARARISSLEALCEESRVALDECIPLVQKWEFTERHTYSYGDGRTEPLEWGYDVQYQQQKPHQTPEGMFLADVLKMIKNDEADEMDTISRRASSTALKLAAAGEK